jgi:hypothetical protein
MKYVFFFSCTNFVAIYTLCNNILVFHDYFITSKEHFGKQSCRGERRGSFSEKRSACMEAFLNKTYLYYWIRKTSTDAYKYRYRWGGTWTAVSTILHKDLWKKKIGSTLRTLDPVHPEVAKSIFLPPPSSRRQPPSSKACMEA